MRYYVFYTLFIIQFILFCILIVRLVSRKPAGKKNQFPEYDYLTHLYSRGTAQLLITDRLSRYYPNNTISAVNISGVHNRLDALMVLDLDSFKQVNDTCGHPVGDQLLIRFARLLSDNTRKTDIAGRLGGDEFIIFMSRLSSPEHAKTKAELICRKFEETSCLFPYDCGKITVSIGIAYVPNDGTSFNTLYQKADAALYHAKESGKNCYYTYEEMEHKS